MEGVLCKKPCATWTPKGGWANHRDQQMSDGNIPSRYWQILSGQI